MTLRFYMHQPDTIFAARVDEPSAVTYPVQDITFETVTTGAFGDIKVGMTVLFGSAAGLDDYGRNRVRAAATSTILKIGRSSIGTRDGEVNVVDAAYITVLNDYRIWSKVPYIDGDDNGAMYKDGDLEVGTNTTTPPPVANTGPPAAGTIAVGNSKLTVTLPPYTPNNSFATADGASISSYAWVIPSGVTLAGGSVLTDAEIQVECDPGFYWIELTVTDSNAKTHTSRTFVYARDPASDDTIGAAQITEHRVTRHGQTLSVRVTQDIAATSYLDGSICLLMDGEPESQATRRNILFWGWGQTDPASIVASREATLSEVTIKCVDVGGRLDNLPGFSQAVYNDAKRENTNPTITWAYMTAPHWDKLLHYILHWHSSSLELTDWQWTGVGSAFPFTVREAGGASLFDQVNTQCESLCPAHYFTCDRQGLLACPVDPMLQETGDRTSTVQANIPVSNWSRIKYTHQRPPRTHWLDDSAIVANALVVNGIFSHAPGDAPGQGEMRNTHGEQIAVGQTILNQVTGHRYARMNAPESLFTINLTQDQDNLIDPAAMEWTTVTITAALAAERGLSFTEARGLVAEMSIRYKPDRESVTRSVTLLWERETIGLPAVTVIPPEIPSADDYDPYPEPVEEEIDIFTNPPKAYVIWDEDSIGLTMDILAASPSWTEITNEMGSNPAFKTVQYVAHTNNTMVGLWALVDDGVWWCNDVFASPPVWTQKLSLTDVRAQEVAPDDGVNEFVGMANHGLRPGALHVFTQPADSHVFNTAWVHAYSWNTTDFGENWTLCDSASELSFTGTGTERGYSKMTRESVEWFRDAGASGKGRIFAFRSAPRIGTNYKAILMYSDDDGATWVEGANLTWGSNNHDVAGVRHPFPDSTSQLYIVGGSQGVSNRPNLLVSTDFGDTVADRGDPAGYGGLSTGLRVNQKYNVPLHALTWAKKDSDSFYDLIETDDAGVSWSLVYDPGADGGVNIESYKVPNGWPGDDQMWFLILGESSTSYNATVVFSTDDYFSSLTSRVGDLETALPANWNGGGAYAVPDGFALPKIGINA